MQRLTAVIDAHLRELDQEMFGEDAGSAGRGR